MLKIGVGFLAEDIDVAIELDAAAGVLEDQEGGLAVAAFDQDTGKRRGARSSLDCPFSKAS